MRLFTLKKLLYFFLLIPFITKPALAEQSVSVILSRGIIPYHQAVEGVKKKMSGFRFKEYNLEDETDQGQTLLEDLDENPPALILAVGPEAAYLIKDCDVPCPRVFTMILNPEKVFPDTLLFPGVSMNYPPSTLLSYLTRAFPERKKVGIFFSPNLNAHLVERFQEEGQVFNIMIHPFPIHSSADIRTTINSPHFAPDLILFIPDQAIIKEKLIKYIVEESLFRKIPAVGFNTWFAKSGALLAFYLDYKEMGAQTGELALRLLGNKKREPWIEAPKNLRIILNLKIAHKFNFKISEEITAKADQVIE